MPIAKRLFYYFLLSSLAAFAGCSNQGGSVPVSGVITLDGQPMYGVHVLLDRPELRPNENVGYIGRTDEQGHYVLRPLVGEGSGAPPGKYRVSLTTAVTDPNVPPPRRKSGRATIYDESPPPPPERIPPEYRGGKLTFTVPDQGTKEANFAMKSK